jgi:hypothetical protein
MRLDAIRLGVWWTFSFSGRNRRGWRPNQEDVQGFFSPAMLTELFQAGAGAPRGLQHISTSSKRRKQRDFDSRERRCIPTTSIHELPFTHMFLQPGDGTRCDGQTTSSRLTLAGLNNVRPWARQRCCRRSHLSLCPRPEGESEIGSPKSDPVKMNAAQRARAHHPRTASEHARRISDFPSVNDNLGAGIVIATLLLCTRLESHGCSQAKTNCSGLAASQTASPAISVDMTDSVPYFS